MGTGAAHSAFVGFELDTKTAVVAMMNVAEPGPQTLMAVDALSVARG